MSNPLSDTDYIVNRDGSIYHLHLRGEQIADNVIIVGDQGRVAQVSKHFTGIDVEVHNREFVTHTGYLGNNRITVMSTGIGTDNIDIAINELDAAVNIDPQTRMVNDHKRKLNIIRIGTSGTLQEDIPVGAQVIADYGLGFDNVMHFYNYTAEADEDELQTRLNKHLNLQGAMSSPYICKGSATLIDKLGEGMIHGITAASPGFYGPQGRRLRLQPLYPEINSDLRSFLHNGHRVTNFEMETSALYGLGRMLGHECCTCCTIIANRVTKKFSADYKIDVDRLIETVLDRIL